MVTAPPRATIEVAPSTPETMSPAVVPHRGRAPGAVMFHWIVVPDGADKRNCNRRR